MNRISSRLTLIYFLSGACSLIDEVVWVRLLKLTLGNTVYAASVVVSVFLGGLAIGALLMSGVVSRIKAPLRLFPVIEALITVTALLVPAALRYADSWYVSFYRSAGPSGGELLLVQVAVSALLLLIPTVLMGSTLPLLAQVVSRCESTVGHLVGRLYAVNTLGAAFGAFLAGFVLIRSLGVMGAIYVAAALNVLVVLGGIWVARASSTAPTPDELPVDRTPLGQAPARWPNHLLIAAIFTSGFVSIGFELLWMRSIVHLVGAATYVFSSVLTLYLLGNVLGAAAASRLARTVRRPGRAFGLTLFALAIAGLLYLPVLTVCASRLTPLLARTLNQALGGFPGAFDVTYPLIHSAIFFLAPSIAMGLGFPLALEAWHRGHRGAGRATGVVYGANTIGAVVGGIATGFLCIPLFGVQASLTMFSLAVLWLGAALWATHQTAGLARTYAPFAAVAVSAAVFFLPSDLFHRRLMAYRSTELVDVLEGATTTVSVHREKSGDLWLCSSGIQVAGDRGASVQLMLGHLGALLHGDPKHVLTVGFGSGQTSTCLSLYGLETLDCVEISPELVDMALRHFTHLNLGDKTREKVNLIFMDAKNYLHLTPKRYDVIVTDSINPKYFADNASLYTFEYFQAARDHLNPGGLLVCWLPFTLPAECFNSIAGTFLEVFPHASMWFPMTQPDHFVLLVGAMQPQQFSFSRLQERLEQKDLRETLRGLKVYNVFDLASCYLGDERDLGRYFGRDFRRNSDFTPFVEFNTDAPVREEEKWSYFLRLVSVVRRPSFPEHLDWSGCDEARKQEWLGDYAFHHRFASRLLATLDPGSEFARLLAGRGEVEQEDRFLADLSQFLTHHPDYLTGLNIRGAVLNGRRQYDKAVEDFGRVLKLDPGDAFALNQRGLAFSALGRHAEAVADYESILRRNPDDHAAWNNLALARLLQGDFDSAIASCTRALSIEPEDETSLNNRGMAYFKKGLHRQALDDFNRVIRAAPGNLEAVRNRAAALDALGDYRRAVADYSTVLQTYPQNAEVRAARARASLRAGDPAQARQDLEACRSLGMTVDPELSRAVEDALRSR